MVSSHDSPLLFPSLLGFPYGFSISAALGRILPEAFTNPRLLQTRPYGETYIYNDNGRMKSLTRLAYISEYLSLDTKHPWYFKIGRPLPQCFPDKLASFLTI
ncbi:uncharacterized protein BT62DRAFT_500558 [Guyanagaster necrorhizus]|uniref:Uncharacterized protein n=1 Tax=Guyanagaster necrorhizus TaxID=856835 RepID=A0A9P8AWF0_9AGAR|nr:uncharacterized protein BT62DRAFT_500558 [Guyanagaster necrorhizus MCA 3950]KAG7450260.1 hypothetical protein BT62DRAFT_500558 [Guyanagaster necrorhizus MCA 3950]